MMAVIKVENLTKKYFISNQADNKLLRERMASFFSNLFKKSTEVKRDEFFALKNISFEIEEGDIVGVIGANGAGKSTLLKILSKITEPTGGQVLIKGKISSLLEVGTGFHPELTGKENVFLNGSILGMAAAEVQKKYSEIIKFSGVEKFINSPVKYYSSGMLVRLAFSVAAFLDSDILLLDEVLAVGDLKFQRKCLKKIDDLTRRTKRTIIFISHNMEAVKNLCNKVIWLKEGEIKERGETAAIVQKYISSCLQTKEDIKFDLKNSPGNEMIKIKSLKVKLLNGNEINFTINTPLEIQCEFWSLNELSNFNLSLVLFNTEQCVFNSASPVIDIKKGLNKFSCFIPGGLLNDGIYYAKIIVVVNSKVAYELEEMCSFNLYDEREHQWYGKWGGVIRPKLDWKIEVNK